MADEAVDVQALAVAEAARALAEAQDADVYAQASRAVRVDGLRPLIVVVDRVEIAMKRMADADRGLTCGRIGGGHCETWSDVAVCSVSDMLYGGGKPGSCRVDVRDFDVVLVDSSMAPVKTTTVVVGK